jgi:hypothetical protein
LRSCGRVYIWVGPGPYGGKDATLRRGSSVFVTARTGMKGGTMSSGTVCRAACGVSTASFVSGFNGSVRGAEVPSPTESLDRLSLRVKVY